MLGVSLRARLDTTLVYIIKEKPKTLTRMDSILPSSNPHAVWSYTILDAPCHTRTHTHSWYIESEGGGRVGAREGTREGGSKVRVGWSKGTLGGSDGAMM